MNTAGLRISLYMASSASSETLLMWARTKNRPTSKRVINEGVDVRSLQEMLADRILLHTDCVIRSWSWTGLFFWLLEQLKWAPDSWLSWNRQEAPVVILTGLSAWPLVSALGHCWPLCIWSIIRWCVLERTPAISQHFCSKYSCWRSQIHSSSSRKKLVLGFFTRKGERRRYELIQPHAICSASQCPLASTS